MLVLILSIIAIYWAVFSAWALKTGGEVSLWPPRVKGRTRIVGVSGAGLKVELGTENMPSSHEAFYKNVHKAKRACTTLIKFTGPFKQKPQIFLALSKIDVGGSVSGGPIDRLLLRTENERTDGFTLVFETWEDSIVYGATASWIAVGERISS
jgi:hypothetical protein